MTDDLHITSNSEPPVDEPVVDCGICGFTGVESESMSHADAEHAMRPVYECGHCGFLFWKRFDLNLHGRNVHTTAHGKQARECAFCARLFPSPTDLNSHLRDSHATSQPIMCRFCGMFCSGGDMVARHVREQHAASEFLYCNHKNVADFSGDDVEDCGAYFISRWALDEHVRQSHGESKTIHCESLDATKSEALATQFKTEFDRSHGPGEKLLGGYGDRLEGDALFAGESLVKKDDMPVYQERSKMRLEISPSDSNLRLACVVCGLRLSSFETLSYHMSFLHRSHEAAPIRVTNISAGLAGQQS
jgi:hypothetical protein